MAKKGSLAEKSPKIKPLSNRELQFAVIENFVNMQKVLTNLTFKFEILSENISKLLQLFEISAKTFIRKQEEPEIASKSEDKDLIRKLDTLLDQNKTIAKGLTLIEEKIRHKISEEGSERALPTIETNFDKISEQQKLRPRPLPRI